MRKIVSLGLAVMIVVSVGVLPGLFIYWFNQGSPVIYSTRKILTPVVPPGGTLRIQISAEINNHDCTATVHRSVVDAAGTAWTTEPMVRPAFTNYVAELVVPLGASPGEAQYRARVEWACNPIQKWFPLVVLQPAIPFTIAQAEGQHQVPEQQGVYLPLVAGE